MLRYGDQMRGQGLSRKGAASRHDHIHPGSCGSCLGLRHGSITSRKFRLALLPLGVVGGQATGVRGVVQASAKRQHYQII